MCDRRRQPCQRCSAHVGWPGWVRMCFLPTKAALNTCLASLMPNACSPFVFTISTIYILIYFQLQKENRVQSIILIKKIYLTACVLASLSPLLVLSGFPGYSWPPEEAYCPNTSLLPPLTPHSSVDLHPAAFRCWGEIK